MIKLDRIGHLMLSVADEAVSRRFYTEVLGFRVSEQDIEHGGVFMTLGRNYHTLDIDQNADPGAAPRPRRGQIGLAHIAFQVASYDALRDAYRHLLDHGVAILRATNHVNQRSLYFQDPDGNTLEIYYEVPRALDLFPQGREDLNEALPVTRPGEPLPAWIAEDWPPPALKARLAVLETRPR